MNKIIQFPPEEQRLVSTKTIQFQDTGIMLAGEPTREELLVMWHQVQYLQQRSPWYVGDLLNLMEDRFDDGEEMQWVSKNLGIQTLRNYKSVARRIPREMRHTPEELSYSAHARFSPIEDDVQRMRWVAIAADRGWDSTGCGIAYAEIKRGAVDEATICAAVEGPTMLEQKREPAAEREAAVVSNEPSELGNPGPAPDYADITFGQLQLRLVLEASRVALDHNEELTEDEQAALLEAVEEMALALQDVTESLTEHAELEREYLHG